MQISSWKGPLLRKKNSSIAPARQADIDAIRATEQAFYTALSGRNILAMAAVVGQRRHRSRPSAGATHTRTNPWSAPGCWRGQTRSSSDRTGSAIAGSDSLRSADYALGRETCSAERGS